MRITRYPMNTQGVAVDFLADPDGDWDYDTLLEAAGFAKDARGVRVGALSASFHDHAEGAAVVSEIDGDEMTGRYFAIVELGIPTAPSAVVRMLPMTSPVVLRAEPSRAA